MGAVNSWQDDNRGAEVGECECQHIHPSCAQQVSDETDSHLYQQEIMRAGAS